MIDYTVTWKSIKEKYPELTKDLEILQEVKETAYRNIVIGSFVAGCIFMYCIMNVLSIGG